jgi:hypothetical protein
VFRSLKFNQEVYVSEQFMIGEMQITGSNQSALFSGFMAVKDGLSAVCRQAQLSDVGEIAVLEEAVWGVGGAKKAQIESRINVFPEGGFVAVINGKIIAYAVYQRLREISDDNFSWAEITDNGYIVKSHCADGRYLYGVNISANPFAAKVGIIKLLASIIVLKEFLLGEAKGFYLGSRVPGYRKFKKTNPNISINDYVFGRRNGSRPIDPELWLSEMLGFEPVRVLPDYFSDPESEDYGVLIKKTKHSF